MPSAAARASRDRDPRPDQGRLAVARRLAAGYRPGEAARAARVPEAEVDAFLADPAFGELVDAYRAVEDRPEDEQVLRLVRVAKCVLEDALNRGDARAALFVIREGEERGRSPARVLAEGAVRALRRRAAEAAAPAAPTPPPPSPPARPRPAAHPNDRALWRVAARLRRGLVAEYGAMRSEAAEQVPSPQPSPIATATGEDGGEGNSPAPSPDPPHHRLRKRPGRRP